MATAPVPKPLAVPVNTPLPSTSRDSQKEVAAKERTLFKSRTDSGIQGDLDG